MNRHYEAIAQQWIAVVTPYSDFDSVSVQVHIADLAERLVNLLLADSSDLVQAQIIGEALAEIVSFHPEALGKTQRMVLEYFVNQLPAEQIAVLRSRLFAVIAELAIGFAQVSVQTVKEKEEEIRRTTFQFIRGIGYALRLPLNSITEAVAVLQEESDKLEDEKLLHCIHQIESESKLLHKLVDDVTVIAKWEDEWGKVEIRFEEFDISNAIQDVVKVIRPVADKKGNTLEVHYADNIGSMYSDVRRVRQVLTNLLGNASKFTEQGTITLHASRETKDDIEKIVFKISDTGIGISSERQQRLLIQPVRHLSEPNVPIGLRITHRFCHMLGGNITVESEVGKGSVFTVCFPAQGKGAG